MNSKFIMATLAGAIASFLLGWLIYGFLLESFMVKNTYYMNIVKNPPDFRSLIVSQICWAAFYTLIFQKWANVSSLAGGIKAGLLINAPLSIGYQAGIHSMYHMYTKEWYIIDTITLYIFYTLVCGIIGAVLGIGKK